MAATKIGGEEIGRMRSYRLSQSQHRSGDIEHSKHVRKCERPGEGVSGHFRLPIISRYAVAQ